MKGKIHSEPPRLWWVLPPNYSGQILNLEVLVGVPMDLNVLLISGNGVVIVGEAHNYVLPLLNSGLGNDPVWFVRCEWLDCRIASRCLQFSTFYALTKNVGCSAPASSLQDPALHQFQTTYMKSRPCICLYC